jgi:hypothetical protein
MFISVSESTKHFVTHCYCFHSRVISPARAADTAYHRIGFPAVASRHGGGYNRDYIGAQTSWGGRSYRRRRGGRFLFFRSGSRKTHNVTSLFFTAAPKG